MVSIIAGKLKLFVLWGVNNQARATVTWVCAIVLLQLQNPRNDDDNGDEKEDDDAGNADDNDEDYQYGGKKEAHRPANDGRLDCTIIWSLVGSQ